jgi:hypothetical protein
MPAIGILFAGTQNLCPGTRMARSIKTIPSRAELTSERTFSTMQVSFCMLIP